MKSKYTLRDWIFMIVLFSFSIGTIAAFINGASYSPMQSHIEYIQAKHNDSCQYKQGECPEVLCSHYDKPANKIIKTITDKRGLTSVVYMQDGREYALDYLTPLELDSLKIALK